MSAHSRKIVIAPLAQQDISDILLHTQRMWGRTQRTKYRTRLYGEFDQLAMFPYKGRARNELSLDLRSIPIDQYVIYYRVDEVAVTIRRIIHSRQEIANEEF